MPPALARYWASRGRGGGGGGGGGGARIPARRGGSKGGIMAGMGLPQARPVLIALFALAGYLSGKALSGTGLPQALYTASSNKGGKYAAFINAGWAANGGSGNTNNPFSGGAVNAWVKTVGFLLGGWGVARSVHTGHVSGSTMNVIMPLAVGMALDPVEQTSSVAGPNARWG